MIYGTNNMSNLNDALQCHITCFLCIKFYCDHLRTWSQNYCSHYKTLLYYSDLKLCCCQLPRILQTDAIARYYGLEKGEVVKITYSGNITQIHVTYRCVW
ncbi:hypothetical protein AAHE18_U047200 [Arachis hypogaea]